MRKGILAKDTQDIIIRIAAPLIIRKKEIDWAVSVIAQCIGEFEKGSL